MGLGVNEVAEQKGLQRNRRGGEPVAWAGGRKRRLHRQGIISVPKCVPRLHWHACNSSPAAGAARVLIPPDVQCPCWSGLALPTARAADANIVEG
jgi:hypothetical protein